jgi:hypothetical protein
MQPKPVPFSKFTRKQQEILNWIWATRSDEPLLRKRFKPSQLKERG